MRKFVCFLLVCGILILCSCRGDTQKNNYSQVMPIRKNDKVVGVWISYSELEAMLESDFKVCFTNLLNRSAETGITDVFVHVRAFCDSVYPSDLFPLSKAAESYNGDLLSDMIALSHKAGIRFHAWINPYRVRTGDENIDALPEKSPARIWLRDDNSENDTNVCFCNGIYLNPASEEVRRIVIDGIREIITKYNPDGIHFDDYFYPTSEASFDEKSYSEYVAASENALPLEKWRTAQVNMLISGCYTAVKFCNREAVFSISPAASVEKNQNMMFADIPAWLEAGCVDWIIPQLYFGFEYPEEQFRFDNLLNEWSNLTKADNVRLIIGIAAYKLGTESEPDSAEWGNNSEILSEQVDLSLENADGAVFFSSGSLFSENELNCSALELIKNNLRK